MPTVDEFRSAIRLQFREAELRGAPYIEINSGRLHRQLGGYPARGAADVIMLPGDVSRGERGR